MFWLNAYCMTSLSYMPTFELLYGNWWKFEENPFSRQCQSTERFSTSKIYIAKVLKDSVLLKYISFLGDSWVFLGNSWVLLGNSWVFLGNLNSFLANSWVFLGTSWVFLGNLNSFLANSWVFLGTSWVFLGNLNSFLANSWVFLGTSWVFLGNLNSFLANSWVFLGTSWVFLGIRIHIFLHCNKLYLLKLVQGQHFKLTLQFFHAKIPSPWVL